MKLLTHNMLACHIRSHKHETPQPFIIEATEIEEMDADFDSDFLRHIWDRIEWGTLRAAAISMGAMLMHVMILLRRVTPPDASRT